MIKKLQNKIENKNQLFIILPFFYLCFLTFTQVNAQTLSVKGRITASRVPVKYASVTIIDKSDTTRRFSGMTNSTGNYEINVMTTSVESNTNSLPAEFELVQNYPNPFSSSTAIPYNLNKQSDIQVTIYDILGREVRNFSVGFQTAGFHNILWDGKSSSGQRVATGVYFYKLLANGKSQVRKMIFNSNGRNGLAPVQLSYSPGLQKSNKAMLESNQGINYMVRIENSDSTSPIIIPQQIDNVLLQKDTAMNFSLTYIPSATIDFSKDKQYIRGFGAANIIPWRPEMTDSEIETAFGTGEGQLGFTILRLMVQPDKSQWYRNLAVAKKAQAKGVLIFASPWDPPAEMIETVGGQKKLRPDMYDEYAAHLDSFNTYMESNGVPLYAISIQNEPDYGDWTRWTAGEILTFMKNNAQNINNRIIAPESFQFRRDMSDPILKDSAACANLDIVGGHIYGAGVGAYPLAEEKGKEIWMTEHYTESSHSAMTWSLAMDVAKDLQGVMLSNWNAYVWWYIVRFYGPIGDGESNTNFPNEKYAKKGEITKRGYIMSQFSRFIRPGFYRVESSISPFNSEVSVTAYKDPSSSKVIIVAANTGSTQVDHIFRIKDGNISAAFTPYTTSETKNCEKGEVFTVTNGNFTYTMEPGSITTFVSE